MSRRLKLAVVAGLSAFLVLVGSTAGFAYWTASTTVTSTVGAAVLNLTSSNLTSATYGNDVLTATGSVTATNSTVTTSTQSGAVTLTIAAASSTTLAGKVTRTYWSTTDTSTCTNATTAPASAASTAALWNTTTTLNFSLAKNASQSYCVRSTIASRETVAVAGGAMSFQPQITGVMTVGNFSDTEVAATTQATQYIYPASTTLDTTHWTWIRPNFTNANWNYCLDVSGAATTSGTIVIGFGCKNAGVSNQQWKFTASGVSGYYTIQPRNSTGLRIDNGSSTASGAGLSVVTAGTAATAKNQQWQLQQVSTGVYEIVSAYSGLCMTSPAGTDQNLGQLTQAPCNGTVQQQFKLSQAFENFTCSNTSSTFTYSWTSASTGAYHVRIDGQSTDIATTAASASSVSFATSTVPKNTTYTLDFIDGNGTLVGMGTISRTNSNTASYSCTADDLQ